MHIESGSIAHPQTNLTNISVSNLLPALCVAAFGLVLIFSAGFAETQVLHNATHDARHSAGFPCH